MDFERAGRQPDDDETAVNLRAYFDRVDPEKLRQYDPAWTDQQLSMGRQLQGRRHALPTLQ